jgi:hypothetical protein
MATTNTTSSTSKVNSFFYQKDDSALRQQLIDISNTFFCTNGQQNTWIAFFQNSSNILGILEAKEKYGIPPRNRDSERPCWLCDWVDYCDWGDMYRFYFYAQLAMDYPKIDPNDKNNCYLIDGFLEGLENEKTLAQNRFVSSNDNDKLSREIEAIGEKMSYYKSLQSKMNCSLFKQQELDRRALLNEQTSSQLAANVNKQALKEALNQPQAGGGTKIGLYVGIGTAILIAGLVTYKVLSK